MGRPDPRQYRTAIPAFLILSAAVLCLTGRGNCEVLDLQSLVQRAMVHAWDLRIAETDIEISRYRRDEVRSRYFPEIMVRYYDEYVHVPGSDSGEVVSAGDTVLANDRSGFQNTLVASLGCSLYDFGARALAYENAHREVRIAELETDRRRLEVRQKLLEHYVRGLLLQERIAALEAVLGCRRGIYRASRDLSRAGMLRLTRVEAAALNLAEDLERLEDLRREHVECLGSLGVLTGEHYDPDTAVLSDLPNTVLSEWIPDAGGFPEIRAIDAQIALKETECRRVRREMLPRLRLQGAYRLYGSDPDNITAAIGNLAGRDASIALVAEWNLFSGFRDLTVIGRLRAEKKRLIQQRSSRMAELRHEIRSAADARRRFDAGRWQADVHAAGIERHERSSARLAGQGINDRITDLNTRIRIHEQRLEVAVRRIEDEANRLRLRFWQEGAAR